MGITRKHIYSIKEQCTNKVPSDDTRLEDRFILHQMNIVREVLIKQSLNEGNLDNGFYQLKCCIPIECDRIVCNGIDSGEKTFYAEIPTLVEGIGYKNITYFGNVEFNDIKKGLHKNWDRYDFEGWLSVGYREWTHNRPSFTVLGGYKAGSTNLDGTIALLKNIPNTGGKILCVNGIFSNPEDGVCDPEEFMDMEYPIGSLGYKMELIVIKQILSTEVSLGDDTNNARDDSTNAAKTGVKMNDPEQYGTE